MKEDYISKMLEETFEPESHGAQMVFEEAKKCFTFKYNDKAIDIPMNWSIMQMVDLEASMQVIDAIDDGDHLLEVLSLFFDEFIHGIEICRNAPNFFSVNFLSDNEIKLAA